MLGEIQGSETPTVDRHQELTALGFEKIGNINLYAFGDFVVRAHPQKPPELLVNYSYAINPSEIVAVSVGSGYFDDKKYNRHEADTLHLLYENPGVLKAISIDPTVWHTEVPDSIEIAGRRILTQSRFTRKTSFLVAPLAQQLEFAGFSEVDTGIFERVIDVGRNEQELESVIFVLGRDGKAEKIVRSVPSKINQCLHARSRFTAIETYQDTESAHFRPETIITITDNVMEYKVTSGLGGNNAAIIEGSRRLLVEMLPIKIGLSGIPGTPWKEPIAKSFTPGMRNSDEAIRQIQDANGISIAEIEKLLQNPDKFLYEPWLRENQSFIDHLLQNNKAARQMKLTHQQFAAALEDFVTAVRLNRFDQFIYYGRRFQIEEIRYDSLGPAGGYDGFDSPFGDGKIDAGEMRVTNVDTKEELVYDLALPQAIRTYGFYGPSSPKDIVRVLDFFNS